jgi:hypothetical protein
MASSALAAGAGVGALELDELARTDRGGGRGLEHATNAHAIQARLRSTTDIV